MIGRQFVKTLLLILLLITVSPVFRFVPLPTPARVTVYHSQRVSNVPWLVDKPVSWAQMCQAIFVYTLAHCRSAQDSLLIEGYFSSIALIAGWYKYRLASASFACRSGGAVRGVEGGFLIFLIH